MKHSNLSQMLIDVGVLADKGLIRSFDLVDRRDFLPDSQKSKYLDNTHLSIGHGQSMTQPFSLAYILELLLPLAGDKVLHLGTGSGWSAALIAANGAEVISLEKSKQLALVARTNLQNYKHLRVKVIRSDAKLGHIAGRPYDKIISTFAFSATPDLLLEQLAENGRAVIPMSVGGKQVVRVYKKTKTGIESIDFPGFVFSEAD